MFRVPALSAVVPAWLVADREIELPVAGGLLHGDLGDWIVRARLLPR